MMAVALCLALGAGIVLIGLCFCALDALSQARRELEARSR